jgi:hypothetical protein
LLFVRAHHRSHIFISIIPCRWLVDL